MTSTETAATPDHLEYDTDTFGVGEVCGVCIFPTAAGQICGNPVYANQPKGRLPKYCGQLGQEQWQVQHRTEGNTRHRSDLAGYPRRQFGMTKEDIAALEAAEIQRQGITRRLKSDPAPEPTPAESVAAQPVPVGDLASALPESPLEALAELATLIQGRVIGVRAELAEQSAAAERRAAEIEAETEQTRAELDEQRAALEADRAAAQAATAQARAEIREAREAQLRAEGGLASAQARIAELEQQIETMRERHQAELEEVRLREEARFERIMDSFARTAKVAPVAAADADPAAATPAVEQETPARSRPAKLPPVTEAAVRDMAGRVARGEITKADTQWQLDGHPVNRAAVPTLEHMLARGLVVVAAGKEYPAPVRLSESGAALAPAGPSRAAKDAPWHNGKL